jgi:hypothetical protein
MPIHGRNAYPEVVLERMQRIRAAHVAPINALADKIAEVYDLLRSSKVSRVRR